MVDPAEWSRRDAAVCWHPYTQHGLEPTRPPVVGAQGAWLQLADGSRILDAICSWWSVLHGHAEPSLVAALHEQAARLDHVMFAGFTHPAAVQLAEELLAVAPQGLSRVFYSDNGSTAVEVALKAAYVHALRRRSPGRRLFLALEEAYHGDTFGAMAAGDPNPFWRDYEPLLFSVVRAAPEPAALEAAFAAHGDSLAAVIVEPLVQGAGGMKMYGPEVLQTLRRLCDAHSVLLIADEVMTGFGRTGTLFACQQAGITPDLMCLAKGLTGGIFPMAATLVTDAIYEAFLSGDEGAMFFHGHTFTASALGCAVALASLALVRERNVPARLDTLGRRIEAGVASLRDLDAVAEVRRCGGIVAIELHDAAAGYLADVGGRLQKACTEGDVLLRPLGNVVYAMPPACTTDAEADHIAAAMQAACRRAVQM